jgi:trimeric autotransporter adhesin
MEPIMNTAYRNIWNAVTGTFIAAAETARGTSKGASRHGGSAAATVALAVCLAVTGAAQAQNGGVSLNGGVVTNATGIAIDGGSNSSSCAPDSLSPVTYPLTATATGGNSPIAIGCRTLANGHSAIALGAFSQALQDRAVALGMNAKSNGINSLALGYATAANGNYAVALGSTSEANKDYALAIGSGAKANNSASVALGALSQTNGDNAVAIGKGSNVTAANSVAIGVTSTATADSALAMGNSSNVAQSGGTAIGSQANAASVKSSAVGYAAQVGSSARYSTAVGANATVADSAMYSVAMGAGQPVNGSAQAGEPFAAQIGKGASYGVALGSGAKVADSTQSATAIGSGATASVSGGVAVGSGALASRAGGLAGYVSDAAGQAAVDATKATTGAVSVGDAANGKYRQITDVAAGTQASDAVNVAQLQATDVRVTNLGNTVGDIDKRVSQNTWNIQKNRSDIENLQVIANDAVLYDSPEHRSVTLGGASSGSNPVRLTNVERGRIASNSTDVVNGSQLHGTSQSIADALGGDSVVNEDGSISRPTIRVNGTTITNVTEAIENVDARTILNTQDITNLTTNVAQGTIGIVQQSGPEATITVGKDSGGALVDFSARDSSARQLYGVADGLVAPTSVYAINGSQLYGVSQSIANAFGGGSYVRNDGTISAPSYQVGGKTYNSVGTAIENLDGRMTNIEVSVTNIGSLTGNGEASLVQQDTVTGNITVGASTGGTTVDVTGTDGARTVTGVADGQIVSGSQDAINGGQLYALTQQMGSVSDAVVQHQQIIGDALSQANAYTDQRVGAAVQSANGYTDQRVTSVRRDASAGTAAAMAMAGLPQATLPGKGMTALAGSTYDGQAALALGVSRMSGTGKWVIKGTASTNTRGYYGFSVGAGRHW